MTAATPDSETSRAAPPEPRLARLRVNAAAIADNWRFFKKLAPNAATAAVVKADAYGLGAPAAAKALAEAGARTFFTATFGEALRVRKALGDGPQIMVLNGPAANDAQHFAALKLTPVLNSLEQITLWNGRGPAALHIDTGMNRLGIGPDELAQAATALKNTSLALIMSHLACASDMTHEMNATQRIRFIDAASLFPSAPLSLAATSGALIGADYHFDLIRPGIGLYGSGALDKDNPQLATTALVEAPILQVRDVAPGETFGYGATFTATRKMRTATVALGYADGYLRTLSGRGYGVIGGGKRPILGRVSMDLIILDVTGCADARPGAWVEFLGPNAPLDEIASLAGTAPYEILTTFAGMVRKTGGKA
ncbi:alanine racemase [Terricaulis sp.]|uniref:alanine racemase n=1 Tax=Terricaulis sp. TaxID=2768686 RepID=UPI0037843641